jgi:hypothetical protein
MGKSGSIFIIFPMTLRSDRSALMGVGRERLRPEVPKEICLPPHLHPIPFSSSFFDWNSIKPNLQAGGDKIQYFRT